MNKIVIILVLSFLSKAAFSQRLEQSAVPAVVLNAFQLKYPSAEDVSWKKEKANYLVYYIVNTKSHKLRMDYKGEPIEHFQDLYLSEIPKEVLTTIKSKISNFDLRDADLQERNGVTTYVTKFNTNGSNSYFWINEKGELQKYRKELKDSEIPTPILSYINSRYGKIEIERAKYVEDNGNNNFIIGGKINGKVNVFWFNTSNSMLKHTQDLRNSDIPETIQRVLSTDYSGYDIRDADMIHVKGSQSYILRLKSAKDEVRVTFDKNGKTLEVN